MALRINAENFEEKVLKADKPVLVDFYSDSCIPCKQMAGILGDIEDENEDDIYIYKVNVNYDRELAEKYNIEVMTMVGFLDGIDESLKVQNPIEDLSEDTEVSLEFDKEKLYKNMVDAKADWLYELPMWDEIFDAEKKKELYKEAKKANTVVKGKKIGRNDPCPCGSGKKYKFCCGKNA